MEAGQVTWTTPLSSLSVQMWSQMGINTAHLSLSFLLYLFSFNFFSYNFFFLFSFFFNYFKTEFFCICRPGCPRTCYIIQAGLELTEINPPASASQVLRLMACTIMTTAWLDSKFLNWSFFFVTTSASQVLGLKACATTARLWLLLNYLFLMSKIAFPSLINHRII